MNSYELGKFKIDYDWIDNLRKNLQYGYIIKIRENYYDFKGILCIRNKGSFYVERIRYEGAMDHDF